MIRSIKHKGLKRFYESGDTSGIQTSHQHRLRRLLGSLEAATQPSDMGLPGYRLHPLKGQRSEFWSVTVNGSWRLIFRFANGEPEAVDYLDYH